MVKNIESEGKQRIDRLVDGCRGLLGYAVKASDRRWRTDHEESYISPEIRPPS